MIVAGEDLQDLVREHFDTPVTPDPASIDLHVAMPVTVEPHSYATVEALEQFEMPTWAMATVTGRSSHMRRGVTMPGGFVDPGFRSPLELEFFNHGDEPFTIKQGEAGGRLVFFELTSEAPPYEGRWQG